jgi:hypothetical protein
VPGVGYRDRDELAAESLRRLAAVEHDVARRQCDRAALADRVACIEHQVQHSQFELVGVDGDRPGVGIGSDAECDRRPDRSSEQGAQRRETLSGIDCGRIDRLAAGEAE